MEVTLNDQLILERDITQLQQDKSHLEELLERKKRELLSAIDLAKKESEKLKGLQDEQIKIFDRIRNAQLDWNTEKREQEEELSKKQIEVTKILNRESFIKAQTQKLVDTENALIIRENIVSEKEKGFINREIQVKDIEEKANKLTKEAKQILEKAKIDATEIKNKILNEINKW